MKTPGDAAGGVLVVAPLGKDAALAVAALAQAEVTARICSGLEEVARTLNDHTEALLIAQEALAGQRGERRLLHEDRR